MKIPAFLGKPGNSNGNVVRCLRSLLCRLGLVATLLSSSWSWAENFDRGNPQTPWPLQRNGISRNVGGTNYFNSPTVQLRSQQVGRVQYHQGYDRESRQSFSSTTQQIGRTTYYQPNPPQKVPSFAGRSYPVGGTTYYEGRDSQSGKPLSGRSYQVGNKTYYELRESGGKQQTWSSQNIGNNTYYSKP
jgi:hypothetical protein